MTLKRWEIPRAIKLNGKETKEPSKWYICTACNDGILYNNKDANAHMKEYRHEKYMVKVDGPDNTLPGLPDMEPS